jgi:hypothetical protein
MEGTARFRAGDVREEPFASVLREAASAPVRRIREFLPPELVADVDADGRVSEERRGTLPSDLNSLLREKTFYREADFAGITHGEETRKLLAADRDRLRRAELEHLNRLLLEEALNLRIRSSWLLMIGARPAERLRR